MYQKMLRFTLDDKGDRTFRVQRWCFKGSIDDWIDLWMSGGWSGNYRFWSRRFAHTSVGIPSTT